MFLNLILKKHTFKYSFRILIIEFLQVLQIQEFKTTILNHMFDDILYLT